MTGILRYLDKESWIDDLPLFKINLQQNKALLSFWSIKNKPRKGWVITLVFWSPVKAYLFSQHFSHFYKTQKIK